MARQQQQKKIITDSLLLSMFDYHICTVQICVKLLCFENM